MGSANNRKKNDQPLIKRPKTATDSDINKNSGEVAVSQGSALSNICPITLQVKITKTNFTHSGVRVELIPEGDLFGIYILNHKVGVLNKKNSDTIVNCSQLGIKYNGEVVDKNDVSYARFTRIA